MDLQSSRKLVEDKTLLAEDKKTELINYLHQEEDGKFVVKGLDAHIEKYLTYKAKVKGIRNIGSLTTLFGDLGFAHCRSLYGTGRFTIAQAWEILHNPLYNHHFDIEKTTSKIISYSYRFDSEKSDPKVIVLNRPDSCEIADGNHTALAAYRYALKKGGKDFELNVYYIDASDGNMMNG